MGKKKKIFYNSHGSAPKKKKSPGPDADVGRTSHSLVWLLKLQAGQVVVQRFRSQSIACKGPTSGLFNCKSTSENTYCPPCTDTCRSRFLLRNMSIDIQAHKQKREEIFCRIYIPLSGLFDMRCSSHVASDFYRIQKQFRRRTGVSGLLAREQSRGPRSYDTNGHLTDELCCAHT